MTKKTDTSGKARDKQEIDNPAHQEITAEPKNDGRWKPGQSGNPRGRPSAGAAIKEWWNVMADWPEAKLKNAIRDPEASNAKVSAAQEWIKAREAREGDSGRSADGIIDHTDGRARQGIDHNIGAGIGLGIIVRIEDGTAPVLPPPPKAGIEVDKPKELPDG